jgi:hypothetical protein
MPKGAASLFFTVSYTTLSAFLPRVMELFAASKLTPPSRDDALVGVVARHEAAMAFNPSWLVDGLLERTLLDVKAVHVSPLLNTPGRLLLTSLR